MGKFFYAVRKGRKEGIFTEWYGEDGAFAQVKGFSGAVYKKFPSRQEAEAFLEGNRTGGSDKGGSTSSGGGSGDVSDSAGSASSGGGLAGEEDSAGCVSSTDGQAGEFSFDISGTHMDSAAADGQQGMPEDYAFTDGSYNVGTGVYGFGGFLMHGGERIVLQGSGNDPEWAASRNVSGEVLGAMEAVREASACGVKELVIYYDYAGVENWATGAWKANKTSSQEYAAFMKAAADKMRIRFCHVKAHTGIPGNEEADRLAKEAVGLLPGGQAAGDGSEEADRLGKEGGGSRNRSLTDSECGSVGAVSADRLRKAFAGRSSERLKRPKTKESAVLIPLVERDGTLCMLFEVRGEGIPQAGEICFPGGRIEPGEAPRDAAIRETAEELLLSSSQIEMIAPLFEQPGVGGGTVYSFLGLLHEYEGTFSPGEVAKTFLLPVKRLLQENPLIHDDYMQTVLGEDFPFDLIPGGKEYPFRRVPRRFYFYKTGEGVIWGMTAELLYAALELLRDMQG